MRPTRIHPLRIKDPERARKLAARLVHDVAKYISRTARNLQGREVTDALLPLLVDDLYTTRDGQSASRVFEERIRPLEPLIDDHTTIRYCRDMLTRIDRLEIRLRGGEANAVRTAACLAMEVDRSLRSMAEAIAKEQPEDER